jgi:hypothetical protein
MAVAALQFLCATTTLHDVSDDVLMITITSRGVLRFVIKGDAGVVYIDADGYDFLVHMSDDTRTRNEPYRVDSRDPKARATCMGIVDRCAAELRTRRFIAGLQQH